MLHGLPATWHAASFDMHTEKHTVMLATSALAVFWISAWLAASIGLLVEAQVM